MHVVPDVQNKLLFLAMHGHDGMNTIRTPHLYLHFIKNVRPGYGSGPLSKSWSKSLDCHAVSHFLGQRTRGIVGMVRCAIVWVQLKARPIGPANSRVTEGRYAYLIFEGLLWLLYNRRNSPYISLCRNGLHIISSCSSSGSRCFPD